MFRCGCWLRILMKWLGQRKVRAIFILWSVEVIGSQAIAHYVPPNFEITSDIVAPDGIHFSEEAHSLYAQTLLEKMEELGLEF